MPEGEAKEAETTEGQLTLAQIEAEPKADLHLHLDGAVPGRVIWDVAQRHGIVIPGLESQSEAELAKTYPDPGPFHAEQPAEFNRFLALFGKAFSVMLTPKTIHDTTLEVIRDLKKQNVIYAELRFAPSYHASPEHPMEEMIASVLAAMKKAEAETGVVTRLIIIIPREIAYQKNYQGPSATRIVQTALDFEDRGVVGIDLACSEHYGPEPYMNAFRQTFGRHLRRTVHAGEAGPQMKENIWMALGIMMADGVGHALPLADDHTSLNHVQRFRVRVERAPLSNQAMCVGDGDFDQLDRLLDEGILVSVNSDDPGIFGPQCSLANNLLAVGKRYGLGIKGIRDLTQYAINSAFISGTEKGKLMARFLQDTQAIDRAGTLS